MSWIWIVSMVLQWLVIGLLCLLVLSLMRQLGAMTIKVNAMREGDDQPALYSRIPAHEMRLTDGSSFTVGGQRGKPLLVTFFSPSCGACEALPPAIKQLVAEQGDVEVLAVISIEADAVAAYIAKHELQAVNVMRKDDFPEQYFPRHGVPFAVGITTDGVVAARGGPKNLSHLREMAYAAEHMAELATTTSVREHEWGQSVPYWQLQRTEG